MNKKITENVIWHYAAVNRKRREEINKHESLILWFTGLSGSGKSTLAHAVEEKLFTLGCKTFVFDGDNVRHGLCSDLGFTKVDRTENIRRIGEVTNLFMEAGIIALTAFISPFIRERQKIRELVSAGDFVEIYCKCPLHVCENRDVKGHYKSARKGDIKNFTGISSPYEEPEYPEIIIETNKISLYESVDIIILYLRENKYIGI